MTLQEAIQVVESMQANSAAAVASWDAEGGEDPRGLRDLLRRKCEALKIVAQAARTMCDCADKRPPAGSSSVASEIIAGLTEYATRLEARS